MNRLQQFLAAVLAGIGMWTSASTAQGGIIAVPPSGPARIAKADAVIVGKVDVIEPQDVKIDERTSYRIAVVKITQGLKGAKDVKLLRVGFIPLPKPPENGKPRIIRTGAQPIQLTVGQEGLFVLKKHEKQDFYVIGGVIGYWFSGENKDFDKELQAAKTSIKVLDNPQAALKGKDAEERLLAATILIEQYRAYRGPAARQEPIDAEESKQILQTLADADWQAHDVRSLRPSPARLFQKLGVTAKDGFTAQAGANFQAAAQTWLRENAGKYRIQRLVGDAK